MRHSVLFLYLICLMFIGLPAGATAGLGFSGVVVGDPAPGKLIPYYEVNDNLATLIGVENTLGNQGPHSGNDVFVHVVIFTTKSVEQTNFSLCLSPFDFGFIVLQKSKISAVQADELTGSLQRFRKGRVITVQDDGIQTQGYVSLQAIASIASTDGSCSGERLTFFEPGDTEPLAAWAILQDVGQGFFATEIPTLTAAVNSGVVSGGAGAYGLFPQDSYIAARFDINPNIDAHSTIYVWLASNDASRAIVAWLDCEDEFEMSTLLPLPNELNLIDPTTLPGVAQCRLLSQHRGVLRFKIPDDGFVWSQITQAGLHFREHFLGYRLKSPF